MHDHRRKTRRETDIGARPVTHRAPVGSLPRAPVTESQGLRRAANVTTIGT